MKLFFHQSIILLLLLLQGVTPLVHAHVSGDGSEYGLHIDGISSSVEKSSQLLSFESISHTDIVIGMQAAVQQKNKLFVELPTFGHANHNKLIKLLVIENQPLFFSFVSSLGSVTYRFISAPRAPPS